MQSEILMVSILNSECLQLFVLFTLYSGFSSVRSATFIPRSSKIYQLCSKILQACLSSPIFHFSETHVLESIPNVWQRHPWILATLPFLCPNCSGWLTPASLTFGLLKVPWSWCIAINSNMVRVSGSISLKSPCFSVSQVAKFCFQISR